LLRSLSFGGQMTCCQNIVGYLHFGSWIELMDFSTVPVKYEHVVFCGLSDFQRSLYRLFISSPAIKALLRGQDSQPLKAINILKKLCNHPELLNLPGELQGCDDLIPEGFVGAGASNKDRNRNQGINCEWGGKFVVLERWMR
jgi:DNA repair and recombination protein RAD54 and RAD54-like protein